MKKGKPLWVVFSEEEMKKKKKLTDEELKSHLSPYWKKAAEHGKFQIPNSITDKPS